MKQKPSFGVSFSLHRCSELGIDKKATLRGTLDELGLRRFRLMSYWNIHEPQRGKYNFEELDWQFDLIAQFKGTVTLCVGKRQPRWPECHMPDWAQTLPQSQWYEALYMYIERVIKRYKDHPALQSWQLENEALLKEFGYCADQNYSHQRLEHEYKTIKSLDKTHPLIMTLSDSWGVPWQSPNADLYGISLYRNTLNKKGNYVSSIRPALFYKTRAILIHFLRQREIFIHELQAEPWLSQSITHTPVKEQVQRMSIAQLKENLDFALKTKLNPVDLWGLEWWYWLKEKHARPEYWQTIKDTVRVS